MSAFGGFLGLEWSAGGLRQETFLGQLQETGLRCGRWGKSKTVRVWVKHYRYRCGGYRSVKDKQLQKTGFSVDLWSG